MTNLQPLIHPSPDALPFWDACRRGELVMPTCNACARLFFYPRTSCPECGSRDLSWTVVSGRGTIHAFCIQHQSGIPGLRDATPFVTALVDLEEGPRMMAFLVDVEPDPAAISCGQPVMVSFLDVADGNRVPAFKPAAGRG